MKKVLLLASLAFSLCASAVQAQIKTTSSYGATFALTTYLSPARYSILMEKKDKMENVQLMGYISEVCQKEGCWMQVQTTKTSNDPVLVKMKDHAFKVPKDAAGKNAIVNGTLIKKMQSVEEQKHYLEDAGASKEDIAKIKDPKAIYEMQATGVQFYE